MPFTVNIQVDGIEEAERKVRNLISAVDSKDVEDVMLRGAKIIQKDAKGRAKGSIKKAVVAKKGKARGNMFRSAFAAIDRKKAPHAHLVEAGTKMRAHNSGKSTGRMPAKPFFGPAVLDNKGRVEREVTEGLRKLVGKAVK